MEAKERQSTGRYRKRSTPACSPTSPNILGPVYRSSPSWTNDWGKGAYNESESSDWLSQSVASSTSWSDELEGDITKSLEEQMRLVENTLYRDGSQQLSTRSPLREEIKLWQQNFPHLRIIGEAVKPSVGCQTRSRQEEIEEHIDEIIAKHGNYEDESRNKLIAKKDLLLEQNEVYKEKIKKAVIDQIFARIWPDVVKKIEPVLKKAAENRGEVLSFSPEVKNCGNSFEDEVTSGFNSLTLVEDLSLTSLRTRSGGRSALSARRNCSTVVPIKPVVMECSIPVPSVMSVRASSALRRSPGRLSQPSLTVKYPSPERLLSPLTMQVEVRPVKSAGGRKPKTGERRGETTRARPQYDAKTGRMISRDETRSGLRRNLKTSPPLPWSRHVTLPPIETCELTPKTSESKSKRSTSAFFKGGRLNSASRPNTSLTTKNQVVLSPLDSLQIRQTAVTYPKTWIPEHQTYSNNNCEILQLKPSDQRQRWRNRSNIMKR